MNRSLPALALLAACTGDPEPFPLNDAGPKADARIDGRVIIPDGRVVADGATLDGRGDAGGPDAPPGPYLRTIKIDGDVDFVPAENGLGTTSADTSAFVSWDSDALYLGYLGPAVAGTAATTWLVLYVDIDPAARKGAKLGEVFENEVASFPGGFQADYTWRLRLDGGSALLKKFAGAGQWTNLGNDVTVGRKAAYTEARVPWTSIGGRPTTFSMVSLVIETALDAEGARAGLYDGSFFDGFYPEIPIGAYLQADLSATAPPSDGGNRR